MLRVPPHVTLEAVPKVYRPWPGPNSKHSSCFLAANVLIVALPTDHSERVLQSLLIVGIRNSSLDDRKLAFYRILATSLSGYASSSVASAEMEEV